MTSSKAYQSSSVRFPALWAMWTALLIGIVLTALSGTQAYAASSAPGVERAGIQVQDDDGHDDDGGDHQDDNGNDASHQDDNGGNDVSHNDNSGNDASNDNSNDVNRNDNSSNDASNDNSHNDNSHNDNSHNDNSHNDNSSNDNSSNDVSRNSTPTQSRQPSSVSPSRSTATVQNSPLATAQTFRGIVNYKPRSLQGIWVIGFKAFFVDSTTDLGPELASLKLGDSVDVLYFIDSYGLGRAVTLAGQ